jgi:hypothetical protein
MKQLRPVAPAPALTPAIHFDEYLPQMEGAETFKQQNVC